MKKALVLAGGGTRGSYQNGAVRALRRIGQDDWNLVTGTSIGALNAALIVQKDYKAMDIMWHNLKQEQIINGAFSVDMDLQDMINDRAQIMSFAKDFLKDKGADISPLIAYIKKLYQPEKFFSSHTDFGCVVCRYRTKEPVYVNKEMMKEHGVDWLISTASAYPAFPVHKFDGREYIDGGYFDNLPIDEALQMGADEVIALDLNSEPQHPCYMDRSHITYIFPRVETGSFLSFDPKVIGQLEALGYYDTMKAFHVFDGVKYTFELTKLPDWFAQFQRELLILEAKIKLAGNLNERFRSSQVVTDRLLAQQHARVLTDKAMFYGFLDNLMDFAEADPTRVYTYKEGRDLILAAFADAAKEDYPSAPSLAPDKLLAYMKSLNMAGVTAKMVHTILYPDQEFLSENMKLTVYPFEYALALFVKYLMLELKQE
ncbi:MAG: patatin-like phospholipase family protein [Bulleidia sp.]